MSDFAEALANPIKYQSELEKRSVQLAVLQEDTEPTDEENPCKYFLSFGSKTALSGFCYKNSKRFFYMKFCSNRCLMSVLSNS